MKVLIAITIGWCILTALSGCGGADRPSDIYNTSYHYTDYNVTNIELLCKEMNDGDTYELEEVGSSIVKNNGDCYIRFDNIAGETE